MYLKSNFSFVLVGPTDLTMKSRPVLTPVVPNANGLSSSSSSNSRASPLPHKLNAAEILAVRQLVTGYRESAAFLLRSADELEQLLLQQHSALWEREIRTFSLSSNLVYIYVSLPLISISLFRVKPNNPEPVRLLFYTKFQFQKQKMFLFSYIYI